MNEKLQKERPGAQAGRISRRGKIARLPRAVRDELNQRLLDGESGAGLVGWLNELPETKATLQREFGGRPVSEQNLSEWKQGGFRDWAAKTEAEELMADTLAECKESREKRESSASASRRKGARKKAEPKEMECVTDRVAEWFFPHYVASARGQLAAAQTPAEQWSVLRAICTDLASLRRSDHYVERLRIWREKLRFEMEEEQKITDEEVIAWVKAHPNAEQILWPDRKHLTAEEKQQRIREILGTGDGDEFRQPAYGPSSSTVEAPEPAGNGDSESTKIQVNPT